MRRQLWITLFVIAAIAVPGRAQDLGELLQEVGEAYSEPYLQPLANGFGADMNTGLFHSARVGGGLLPLIDVYVGAKVMGAVVPSDSRTMDLLYTTEITHVEDGTEYSVPVEISLTDAPTVFGESEAPQVSVTVSETISTPDGDVTVDSTFTFRGIPGLGKAPVVPLIVPHVSVGSFMGTDVTIRYLPRIGFQDYGSIGLTGVGVRHSISQYIPLFPISVSAQAMWQKLSIQDAEDNEIFAASALAGNVVASKSLLLFTVYGGLQVERSSIDVTYTFDPDVEGIPDELRNQQIEFGLTGDNNFRAVAGFAMNLGPMLVNVDAGFGSTTIVSGGVGVSL